MSEDFNPLATASESKTRKGSKGDRKTELQSLIAQAEQMVDAAIKNRAAAEQIVRSKKKELESLRKELIALLT